MKKYLYKTIIHFWPVIAIFVLWISFCAPYFFQGKVPYPSTYQVNHFPPWSSYEKFWGPVKNDAMPDIIDQIYPWKYFSIQVLKTGKIPWWNPYSFAGNPHVANVQSAAFSPFNTLFFILPFIDAWSVMVLLQPLLAGIFMYVLLCEYKISKLGSLLGSVSFMFCGFVVVWMAYETLAMSIVFLPVILYAVEKNFQKISWFYLAIISISLAISLFSGHFQTSLYVSLFTVAFVIYKLLSTKNKSTALFVIIFLCIAVIISLIQILPSIQFYEYAVRSESYIKQGVGIPFYYLITLFAPDFFGNPVTRNNWFGTYAEWASFIGIVPFALACIALLKKQKRTVLFFFIAGCTSLIFAIDSPIQTLLGLSRIPVLSTSNPSRVIVLFSFAFSVLAGFGLDELQELIKTRRWKKMLPIVLALIFILSLIWAGVLFGRWIPQDKRSIVQKNLILPTILFFNSLILIGCCFIFKKKNFTIATLILLVGFSMIDSKRFADKWIPFDPRNLVFSDLPILFALQKNVGYGRVFGNLGNQIATYYHISTIEGYDPLYIQRYGEFLTTATTGEFRPAERSVAKLDRHAKYVDRVLDLLGVSLVFHPLADTFQPWAYPVWADSKRFSLLYKDKKFMLFKNNTALPRALLFSKYEIIPNKDTLLKRFYSENFDFRHVLLLEEDPHISQNATGKVHITSYTSNTITMDVQSSASALLFLSDNFYPGWKAFVNGKTTKIYRADYTFRAIVIPSGSSQVEFSYTNIF